ncbi:MAG: N-acetylneuraminate synthase [Candidatus Hodarchaeota archaeon]
MNQIFIDGKRIGIDSPIFLIAEAGINHNGDLKLAKKLIDIAARAKVDAIKFQTFIAEKLIVNLAPKADYQKVSNDDKETFYNMVKKFELNKEDFEDLKNYSIENNLIFLSSPFDETSVEWLEHLEIPAYKIASGELTNFPLLKVICSKGKPILISTGMATLEEVKETVDFIKSNKIEEIVILQCTTNYPSTFNELNLNVIETYKKEFPNDVIGFSDHSLGIEASIGAAAKGAKVIEKHFTIDKELEGPDHKASLDPKELIEWVKSIRTIEKALGSYEKKPTNSEKEMIKYARKSIVTARDIQKGETLKNKDITIKRPGYGIPPKFFKDLINKKTKRFLPKDSIINQEDLE